MVYPAAALAVVEVLKSPDCCLHMCISGALSGREQHHLVASYLQSDLLQRPFVRSMSVTVSRGPSGDVSNVLPRQTLFPEIMSL